MNNFEFIEQIRLRPLLWDSRKHDHDAIKKEELWDEIEQLMGCNKEILKARWKNLRDTYRKLVRKNKNTWPYFGAMDFMRDILANSKTKVVDITAKPPSLEPDYAYAVTLEQSESDGGGESICDGHDGKRRGVKREADDDEHVTETEYVEVEAESCPQRQQIDDDDSQFLLSLLPYFRQVPLNRKLPLRVKIEQLIYEEVYRNDY